jgi:hypothetical protein
MGTRELDHLFALVEVGGPEAEQRAVFGPTEGSPNTHPGQGMACCRFFFRNAYLELVWVHDPAEAQTVPAGLAHLWPQWTGWRTRRVEASIGVELRRDAGAVLHQAARPVRLERGRQADCEFHSGEITRNAG